MFMGRSKRSLGRIGEDGLEGPHALQPVLLVFSIVGTLNGKTQQTVFGLVGCIHAQHDYIGSGNSMEAHTICIRIKTHNSPSFELSPAPPNLSNPALNR